MLKFKVLFAFFSTFILMQVQSTAQEIYDPVKWDFKTVELPNNQAKLEFTAAIEPGWHIYSLDIDPSKGPLPTEFTFNKNPAYALKGKVKEGKYKTEYDANFQMELNFYENKAVFTQLIDRKSEKDFKIDGELSFMVCDDSKCLPPAYVPFEFNVKGATGQSGAAKAEKNDFGNASVNVSAPSETTPGSGMDLEAQIYDPVAWSFAVEDETDSTAFIVATATIEDHWHVYAMNLESDMGPIPTSLNFEEIDGYELVGEPIEGEPKVTYDPNFEMDLSYFDGLATFKQKVRKLSAKPVKVEGFVTYMVCDDEKCLPPSDVDFTLTLAAGNAAVIKDGSSSETVEVKNINQRSNWGIFIIAFLSGFAALLTPCVFPMIPMTVSFFTKQSKTRGEGIKNAIIYGLSIIGIYVFLGVIVTWAFGADILSNLSTDPWFNLFFFILLVVFAISFLGAFEITLPSSWINKADSKADKGGLIGIFFMAFVLALVSFSCTGPIVGTLIVEAATRGGMAPTIGMLGFSLAIALPFALFAAFPGWLNTLPQSGGWLNSVKVVLGFLELALAFKFLSNADLVLDLGLLQREVFIAIWIVIFALLTLYLLGKLRLPHDSETKHLSVPRLLLAMVTGILTIYMIPGLWGAPLNLIAAFPPPMQYSESPMGVGNTSAPAGVTFASEKPNEDQHRGPQNIWAFDDYDKALAYARKVNKPLMVDFTGKACVNCRKMEQQVWSDPEIKRKLAEEVVLVSLYVDLRKDLPKDEQITIDLGGGRTKKLRTVGDKWAAMQEIRYRVNAQPYYVLLDQNEDMLVEPANYQDYGKIDLFNDWLSRGIKKFNGGIADNPS